jgi:hypothetical protein
VSATMDAQDTAVQAVVAEGQHFGPAVWWTGFDQLLRRCISMLWFQVFYWSLSSFCNGTIMHEITLIYVRTEKFEDEEILLLVFPRKWSIVL